ncbi:MAG: nitroreductase family protein [Victivallaceae bacterium]|nr:nitroreductase family protein [Victivallaceae bacterium]
MILVDKGKCVRCGACVKDCIVEIMKPDADGVPFVAENEAQYCTNCLHCLAVCPQGAVICHEVTPENCAPIGELPDPEKFMNLLRQRRSIRQYKDENLDQETLEKLKAALAWTPTGCNNHRLYFVVIEDKTEMDFFRAEMSRMLKFLIKTGIMRLIYPNFKRYLADIMGGKDVVFRNAPHLIVVATPKKSPCAEADPWIALSHFDLFAQSLGVGTCWCGFAVHAFKWNGKMRRKLNLPSGYKIGAAMLFGKPDVQYARATAPKQFQFRT